MSISWDGETSPSVLAPIGSFFALGNLPPTASGGLMAGVRSDGTLYLYFPMPFANHGHVELSNRGTTSLEGASVRIGSRPSPTPSTRSARSPFSTTRVPASTGRI